jgi:hypothetical protein
MQSFVFVNPGNSPNYILVQLFIPDEKEKI